ncbi:MAG: hypothetical protein MN733_15445 [Nitrososphaera sp.]|nr:hypothetical protein [Nitrososphaera sp.]
MTTIKPLQLLLALFLLSLYSAGLKAQLSNYQFAAPPPTIVSNLTASAVGVGGGSTYFYWVVAHYPIGDSLAAGPAPAFNANSVLSVSNFNRVGWTGQLGATSYTVLRTATNQGPFNQSSTCTCRVGNTTSTTLDDVGAALTNFTINAAGSATGFFRLNNRDYSTPRLEYSPIITDPNTGSGFFDKATFVLCNESNCVTGTNLTNEYIVVRSGTFQSCVAFAKTAPTGASLIIDLNRNGTSIFGGTKLVIAAGTQSGSQSTFTLTTVAVNDRLTADIDQIGSTLPGQTVTVVCTWTF